MKIFKVEPVVTEKTTLLAKEHGIYTFKAPVYVTKEEIRQYFKKVFGYDVVKVRTVHIPSKVKRNLLTKKRYIKRQLKYKFTLFMTNAIF